LALLARAPVFVLVGHSPPAWRHGYVLPAASANNPRPRFLAGRLRLTSPAEARFIPCWIPTNNTWICGGIRHSLPPDFRVWNISPR
jgi:hypothetical protein